MAIKQVKFNKLYSTFTESEKAEFLNYIKYCRNSSTQIPNGVLDVIARGNSVDDYLNSTYASRTRWNIYSELGLKAQEFLAVKEMLEEKKLKDLLMGLQLTKRGLTKTFNTLFSKEVKRLEDGPPEYKHYLYADSITSGYLLELLKSRDLAEHSEVDKLNSDLRFIYSIFDIMITFILKENFRMNFVKTQDILVEKNLDNIDFREVVKRIGSEYEGYKTSLEMCLMLFELSRSDSALGELDKAYSYFGRNKSTFSKSFLELVYLVLLNMMINLRNTGHGKINTVLFKLIKEKTEDGILEDLKVDMPGGNHFRDYVSIALSVNETEWAEEFVSNYSGILPENLRLNDLQLAKALISFKKGEFEKAKSLAEKVKLKNYFYIADTYRIRILSEFELGNFGKCGLLIDNFARRLKNYKTMPDEFLQAYKKFVRIMNKMLQYQNSKNQKHKDEIEFLINGNGITPASRWFREKLNFSDKKFTSGARKS